MISIKLDQNMVSRLDGIASKVGIPRGRIAARIIHESLPDIKSLDNIGILRWGSWLNWIIHNAKRHVKTLYSKAIDNKRALSLFG